jgi:ABC-type uncharacterized transport system involved in gliding motility auxiliary subunit
VGRSASLFGLLGLLFIAFGLIASALVGLQDIYVGLNLLVGAAMLLAYLVFGFRDLRALLGQRSTRYGAGSLVYSVLFIALIAGGDYLTYRYSHRWDLTEAGVYTLAPQSKKVVEALDKKLEMTAFVEGGQDPQLDSLLGSYKYAAPKHVSFRLVDPDKDPALVERLKVNTLRSVALQYGKETFVVTDPTEESITNGIIRVSQGAKKIVYFTEGSGEADTADSKDQAGYAQAKQALERENYEVKTLVLPSVQTIPEDASVVVVPGPKRPLPEHAITVLGDYLKRGGHLLLMIGPRDDDPALVAFLAQWGVKVGNDIVIDQQMRLFEGPTLGLQPLTKTYGVHPITQGFTDYTMYPQTRTVQADTGGKKGLQATDLVKTSPTSRSLSDVEGLFAKGTAVVDESAPKGPFSVAVAVEAKLKEMEGQQAGGADEARLVVFGTEQFADNQRILQSRGLQGDLFLNAVGWLVGQSELVSVRSRTVRSSRAELTPRQARSIFYLSVLAIPELMIILGLAVWWRRKSQ